MKYCLVEKGKIVGTPKELPKSWRNVSGLNLCSASELKEKGWLPYYETTIEVGRGFVKSDVIIDILEDSVTATETKRSMTADELEVEIASLRSAAYPSIGDQLDMIFHAGLGGDEFQSAIQAVKDKYPKP